MPALRAAPRWWRALYRRVAIASSLRPWQLPLILLLSLCAVLAQAQPQEAPRPRPLPQDQPASKSVFPAHTGRVVDGAGVIDAATAARLDGVLAAHEAASGDQVVVVTVPALRGMAIEEFGYQLGRQWGIGQRDKNNGVLLIVSRDDRKLRIEVGYGLEGKLTDAQASAIINQTIVPAFRQGDQAGGIERGVDAILQVLKAPAGRMPRVDLPVEAPTITFVEPVENRDKGGRLLVITALVFAGFILLMVRLVRGRPFGPTPDKPASLMLAAATGAASNKARRGNQGNRSSSSSSRASSSSSSGSSRSSSSRSSSSRGGGGSFGGGGASGGW